MPGCVQPGKSSDLLLFPWLQLVSFYTKFSARPIDLVLIVHWYYKPWVAYNRDCLRFSNFTILVPIQPKIQASGIASSIIHGSDYTDFHTSLGTNFGCIFRFIAVSDSFHNLFTSFTAVLQQERDYLCSVHHRHGWIFFFNNIACPLYYLLSRKYAKFFYNNQKIMCFSFSII